MFDAVAVFQSSFRAPGRRRPGWAGAADATDVLSRLVERSLLHRAGARYGMLESLRHFGAARLDGRGLGEVRRRHAATTWPSPRPARSAFAGRARSTCSTSSTPRWRTCAPPQRYLLDAGDHDGLLRLSPRHCGTTATTGSAPRCCGWAAAAAELAEQAGGDPRVADALRHRRPRGLAPRRARPRRGSWCSAATPPVDASGERPYYLLAILGFQALHRGHLAESVAWADVALRSDEGRRTTCSTGSRPTAGARSSAPTRATRAPPPTSPTLLAGLRRQHPRGGRRVGVVRGGRVGGARRPPAGRGAAPPGDGAWPGAAGPRSCSASQAHRPPPSRPATATRPRPSPSTAGCSTTGSGPASGCIQWNMLRAVDELLVRTGRLRPAAVLLGRAHLDRGRATPCTATTRAGWRRSPTPSAPGSTGTSTTRAGRRAPAGRRRRGGRRARRLRHAVSRRERPREHRPRRCRHDPISTTTMTPAAPPTLRVHDQHGLDVTAPGRGGRRSTTGRSTGCCASTPT